MLTISHRMSSLIKTIVFFTKKSKRTFTPMPFNNPQLTPLGILKKQPRKYDYSLPQTLPNRHLYWNRAEQNKLLRQRYNKARLQKLQINPIHDKQGSRLYNRDINQLIAELSSVRILKQSVGRTLANIQQALDRFPQQFTNNGPESDILNFAIQEVHDRHLLTMNFSKFYAYCWFRNRAKILPTQTLLFNFFRHIQAFKQNKSTKLSIQKLGHLCKYIFCRSYPEADEVLYPKPVKFQLFGEGQIRYTTFQDIVPELFTSEYLKQIKSKAKQPQMAKHFEAIQKMPGGKVLVQKIQAVA